MPFGRLHEEAAGDSKLLALSDAAWRMWGMGLIYCQKNLTDGFIPEHAIVSFGIRGLDVDAVFGGLPTVGWPKRILSAVRGALSGLVVTPRSVAMELCTSQVPGKAPLWEKVSGGFQVHDYLRWNDSKDQIVAARAIGKTRRQLYSDAELLSAVRDRDGEICRYCGRLVNWKDRRGPAGATYDHVDPAGGNSLENLVIACRGCNSSKGSKTLAECGMQLNQEPRSESKSESKFGSDSQSAFQHDPASGSGRGSGSKKEQGPNLALAGSLPRDHVSHAVCSPTFSHCVPAAVHDKLTNLLAPKHANDRAAASAALKLWYPTVWVTLAADFVMGDAFKFWQGRFDAVFASKDAGARPERASTVPSAEATRDQYLKRPVHGR